ncbi:hypothetical protein ACFOEQ_08295 [Chryseobacterium arachidis]|uniref:hypothetical protein n=1 Tax=Chryseobacterium arachidis TaxID=1416778 RepID=UPI00361CB161
MNFHTDLIRQGFKQEHYKDAEGNPLKKYSKQNFVVIIKNPDSKLPAHQVVWSCR